MRANANVLPAVDPESYAPDGWAIGTLAGVTAAGTALVTLGAGSDPIAVSTLVQIDGAAALARMTGAKVLLCFPTPATAVLVGFVHDALVAAEAAAPEAVARLPLDTQGVAARVDGRTVTIDAEREIVLRCGKSMVLLRDDGTIVLRGVKITSRASRSQKIRGASVNIN